MRKTRFVLPILSALLLTVAACDDNSTDKKEEQVDCTVETYKPVCDGDKITACVEGKVTAKACENDQVCREDACKTVEAEDTCKAESYSPVCDGDKITACEDGKVVAKDCADNKVCENNACVDKTEETEVKEGDPCDVNKDGSYCLTGGRIVSCVDGAIEITTCENDELCFKKNSHPEQRQMCFPKCDAEAMVFSCENAMMKREHCIKTPQNELVKYDITIPCDCNDDTGDCEKITDVEYTYCDYDTYQSQCDGDIALNCNDDNYIKAIGIEDDVNAFDMCAVIDGYAQPAIACQSADEEKYFCYITDGEDHNSWKVNCQDLGNGVFGGVGSIEEGDMTECPNGCDKASGLCIE